MNAVPVVALALGALLAIVRGWRDARRHRVARGMGQFAAAALLYLCLFPPSARESFAPGELVVLTPGATKTQVDALGLAATIVALPGAPEFGGSERVPDLGTALRRHPGLRHLRIVGGGLPARDRDEANGLVIAFDAAPLPRGVVELDVPASVRAGSVWPISGRVEGVAGGRVELHDPSGATVASLAPGADGRFTLDAQARSEGAALFVLRVLDRDGALVDGVDVPLIARRGEALNVLLLAGAPDPELKYLRRWALDAGVRLDSRMALSEGIALTEGHASLDAEALRKADLAIIDERAWASLGVAQKDALAVAVSDGLGLLLRVGGPVPASVVADWNALGFHVRPGEAATAASLTKTLGLAEGVAGFTRRPLEVEAPDAAPLLRADDGTPLALWRAHGEGRIALWWLADSWRLALAGERARHGTLWSDTLAALARARTTATPVLPRDARVDERAVPCGLAQGAAIEEEGGHRTPLLVGPDACAGFWPRQAGWHMLASGDAHWPFLVRSRDEAPALLAAATQRETRALATASGTSAAISARPLPLPRWPFFIAWLVVATVLWWLERER